jgi:hypothetical protein
MLGQTTPPLLALKARPAEIVALPLPSDNDQVSRLLSPL